MQSPVKYVLIISICMGMYACKTDTTRKTGYEGFADTVLYKKIYTAADSLLFKRSIDSAYQSLPEKSEKYAQEFYEAYTAFYYHIGRDYVKALIYSDSLLAAFEKDDETGDRYMNAVFVRGDILLALERFDEAFTWYYRAKQLVLQGKDTCKYSLYTSRLSMVSFKQRRFKEAADYYRQSIRELEYCAANPFQRFSNIQGTYDNIGIMYSRMGWLDSADVYYNKALSYIAAHEHEFPDKESFMLMARAVIYGNQADIAVKRGEIIYAKQLLEKAIAINVHPKRAPEDAAYSMIKLANIYLDNNQVDSVASLLMGIDSIRKTFPNAELYSRYLRLNGRYAMAKGDSRSAYTYLDKQLRLYDSLITLKQSDPSTDVGSALEQISRQYRLEDANKRKNDYLIIAAIFFAMIFVIKILLWINYRRGRKSIASLNTLNKEISDKNADLLRTLEQLERMRRDRRQLMHVVAHDLRSPVGSITTLAKMVRNGQIEEEGIPEVLDMIIKAGTSAQSLINELLEERARETEGKQELVEVSDLLKYSVNLLRYRASEKQQSIKLDIIPAQLLIDREKLLRIFHNLLDNAIKFSPHAATIQIEMEKIRERLQIRIIDQGIGIPENMRSTLMDEISSFKRKGTVGEASFGLGLSIVAQLIRETNGRVWYESKEGDGTVFYLEYDI